MKKTPYDIRYAAAQAGGMSNQDCHEFAAETAMKSFIRRRALSVNVYRSVHDNDNDNGGATLLVLCEEGSYVVRTREDLARLFRICNRIAGGVAYFFLKPVIESHPNAAGGKYAATSDPRFSRMINGGSFRTPVLPIHDRFET